MEKGDLQAFLAQGLSLEQIGDRVGRHPSTVSYWVRRHGLEPVHRDKHRATGRVDPKRLRAFVRDGLTQREIAERFAVSVATVRYWLRRLDLRTVHSVRKEGCRQQLDELVRTCATHGETLFVRSGTRLRCKRCRQEAVSRRRRAVKRILLEELGGCCALCGYARFAGALQFHHLDPSTKAFSLSTRGVARALEIAREEAKKCVVLCANCHAEVEAGVLALPSTLHVAGQRISPG